MHELIIKDSVLAGLALCIGERPKTVYFVVKILVKRMYVQGTIALMKFILSPDILFEAFKLKT